MDGAPDHDSRVGVRVHVGPVARARGVVMASRNTAVPGQEGVLAQLGHGLVDARRRSPRDVEQVALVIEEDVGVARKTLHARAVVQGVLRPIALFVLGRRIKILRIASRDGVGAGRCPRGIEEEEDEATCIIEGHRRVHEVHDVVFRVEIVDPAAAEIEEVELSLAHRHFRNATEIRFPTRNDAPVLTVVGFEQVGLVVGKGRTRRRHVNREQVSLREFDLNGAGAIPRVVSGDDAGITPGRFRERHGEHCSAELRAKCADCSQYPRVSRPPRASLIALAPGADATVPSGGAPPPRLPAPRRRALAAASVSPAETSRPARGDLSAQPPLRRRVGVDVGIPWPSYRASTRRRKK